MAEIVGVPGANSVSWLPRVEGWRLTRLKHVTSHINRGMTPTYVDSEGVPVINQACVQWDGLRVGNLKYHDRGVPVARGRVEKGDLLVNSTGTGTLGRAAVFQKDGTFVADAHVTIVRALPEFLDSRFGCYALSTPLYQGYIYSALVTGATNQVELSRQGLRDAPLMLPPLFCQREIANFLDGETARIDELIAKKERLMELLDEERLGAVDRLISGEPGPERRLKFCILRIEQGWSPQCENRVAEPDDWGVLKVSAVNHGRFRPEENKALPAGVQVSPELEVHEGDVLMSRANIRSLLGAVVCVPAFSARLVLSDKLYRIAPVRDCMLPEYLPLALRTRLSRHQIERDATGASASMQNVGQDTIRNVAVKVPSIDRQLELVACSRRIDEGLRLAVEEIGRAVRKLREYRTALISAAVTGQINVRTYRKEPEAVLETA